MFAARSHPFIFYPPSEARSAQLTGIAIMAPPVPKFCESESPIAGGELAAENVALNLIHLRRRTSSEAPHTPRASSPPARPASNRKRIFQEDDWLHDEEMDIIAAVMCSLQQHPGPQVTKRRRQAAPTSNGCGHSSTTTSNQVTKRCRGGMSAQEAIVAAKQRRNRRTHKPAGMAINRGKYQRI